MRIGQLATNLSAGPTPAQDVAVTKKGVLPPDHINRLLACNFRVMKAAGDRVLRPFLQVRPSTAFKHTLQPACGVERKVANE